MYGALEVCCRGSDVEVFASRVQKLWRHAVRIATRRYGGGLQACCLFASLPQEFGRHAAGLGTWRCRLVVVCDLDNLDMST